MLKLSLLTSQNSVLTRLSIFFHKKYPIFNRVPISYKRLYLCACKYVHVFLLKKEEVPICKNKFLKLIIIFAVKKKCYEKL